MILEFKNVTGRGKRYHILKDINLSLEEGYIYGLVGQNGAGKTTLMECIMAPNSKYDGEILFKGQNIKKSNGSYLSSIGYVSEDRVFVDSLSAKENAELLSPFYENYKMPAFFSALQEMKLSPGRDYMSMSRGEKLKFQLAFAMGYRPSLYILDEVTAGMDPVFRREFLNQLQRLVAEENTTILTSSHISSEIELKTDYCIHMEDGRIKDFGLSESLMKNKGEKSNYEIYQQ